MKQTLSFMLCLLGAAAAYPVSPSAGLLRLEIRPEWRGANLQLGEPAAKGQPVLSRLDWVASNLELQRDDGTWLATKDWSAFISLGGDRLSADATGLPGGRFQAIRFRVGLDQAMNARTPDTFGPEHPLRPAIDTMHWGWTGGFIFLAVEGRSASGAFSYHLANEGNDAIVTLPVNLQGPGPLTVSIAFDVEKLLGGIDFSSAPNASHSRPGDRIASLLRDAVPRSFRVVGVDNDVYRRVAAPAKAVEAHVRGTHPVTLRVPERFPQLRLPADNPLTEEGMALGAQLFADRRLSINNTQSCASCHDRAHAFADQRQFSVGAGGQIGRRNAMALFNLGWHREMFWDGRAHSLREQVLMPVQDSHEMNETMPHVIAKLQADPGMLDAFDRAFGSREITSDRIAKAIEQNLLGITMNDSRFDRAARKELKLTDGEKRGLQLFVTEYDPSRGLRGADCFHCHGGMLFTDHAFHNNGLVLDAGDVGRAAVTGRPADSGKFKTPSLRNIALTAPYMHDGRFATLEEVVAHYDHGVQRSDTLDPNLAKHPAAGLQLSAREKADLVAFLRTLTDCSLLNETQRTASSGEP